jgi:DNA topoisomerase-1
MLREFWDPFKGRIDEVMERRFAEVIDRLNEALAPYLFPPRPEGGDPRACPNCGSGLLSLKLGKNGAFIGCSNYPECRYTRNLGAGALEAGVTERMIGVDPANQEEVWLKVGRFGPYLQRGSGHEISRSSLPPGYAPEALDLDTALQILALPREIGTDPNTGETVEAGLNRYGAFVQAGSQRRRLEEGDDVLTIGLNRALALLAEPAKRGERVATRAPAKTEELGGHPDDKKPVVYSPNGRFGPYVKHGKVFASVPKSEQGSAPSLDRAVELLRAKAQKGNAKGRTAKAKPASNAVAAAKPKPKPGVKAKAAGSAKSTARRRATSPAESGS